MKPKLLDLFCGAGGCAMGYHRAGFDVVGVDVVPQSRYPFAFQHGDALEILRCLISGGRFRPSDDSHVYLEDLATIHASPPCQGYSRLRHLPWLKGKTYPLLIEATRTALEKIGKPWVMENVEDAPMGGIVLCGQMFGLPTFRHRRFESSHLIMCPSHAKHGQVIGHGRMLNDRGKGSLNNSSAKGAWGNQKIITVAGGQFKKADGERALGIDWMRKDELAQAIPPAYTEYIGKQLMKIIGGAA